MIIIIIIIMIMTMITITITITYNNNIYEFTLERGTTQITEAVSKSVFSRISCELSTFRWV